MYAASKVLLRHILELVEYFGCQHAPDAPDDDTRTVSGVNTAKEIDGQCFIRKSRIRTFLRIAHSVSAQSPVISLAVSQVD